MSKHVVFELDGPGLYFLGDSGGIGKTYLGKLLAADRQLGIAEASFITPDINANDYELNVMEQLQKTADKTIFVDRVDLYMGERLLTQLLSMQDRCIVLDMKQPTWWRRVTPRIAELQRDKDCIKVVGVL